MANEKRLIDADALLEDLKSAKTNCGMCAVMTGTLIRYVKLRPTIDAVEVVHGRWKQARYTEAPLYICSRCDKTEYKQHKYCPNCGALMMDGYEERKEE